MQAHVHKLNLGNSTKRGARKFARQSEGNNAHNTPSHPPWILHLPRHIHIKHSHLETGATFGHFKLDLKSSKFMRISSELKHIFASNILSRPKQHNITP